jgi:hypothetical protein
VVTLRESFDWSFTDLFRYLTTETSHRSEQKALAEIDRAVGDADLPYRVFANSADQVGSEGWASYWRSDVTLEPIKQDERGQPIEPEVKVSPRGSIGWDPQRIFVFRVQSRRARALWPPAQGKGKPGRKVKYDWDLIGTAANECPADGTFEAFYDSVCERLEGVTNCPSETQLKKFLRPIYKGKSPSR